jgi:PKD repeat protein
VLTEKGHTTKENQSEMKLRGKLIMTMIILTCTGIVKAQHTKQFFQIKEQDVTTCASDILHQRMLVEDVEYKDRFERQTQVLRESIERQRDNATRSSTVYTIPIVVHVLHTGEPVGTGSNISDAQIQSAIDALNEDYRKVPGTNGDGAGVDIEMQFCLAARDPNGNPTNGINRVDASSVTNYANEGISIGQGSGASENTVKALSRWDRDDYYNIWIVNEIEDNDGGAGIQGFAYFPSSSAAKDGAVILYNAFGTVGTLKSYTSLNRTATHEIGHAFFLYHTFQGNSCSESNCATQGDQVCDTPPTTSNTGCNSPACSGTQQVENYMDYTHETCMDMFTQGQKDRMRNALETMRSSLITSLGCTPPNNLDAGIVDIINPDNYSCSTSISPEVELKNFGSNTLTSVQIKYRVDGGAIQTYTYSGSLSSGESEMVDLPTINVGTGQHSLEVYTQSPNGGTDGFQSNDDTTTDFEVVSGTTVTVSIEVDNYGNETTWDIQDANGTVVASGGPFPSGAYGTAFETDVCLSNECFDFTIYDSYGDGICCGYGFGGYQVTDDSGAILAESGTDFEESETTEMCLGGGSSSNPPVAEFSAELTTACTNGWIQFNDLSTGNPSSWSWSFPGATPSSSTVQNPSVVYNTPGTKNVTLTVTNANGTDTETKSGYITISSPASLTTSVTDASCHNSSDGSIDLSISGGISPYIIDWSSGQSTMDIDGLDEGTYTVLVVDAAGCQSNTAAYVDAPMPINVSNTTSTDASCSNDGSATVSPSGGSGGYTYLWNDNQQQTGQTASALASGSYTVVVTDSEGCQATTQITVDGGGDINVNNGSKTHVTCFGSSDGTATVNPNGGASPYTYLWSDGQTTQTATGLSGGSIGVTVTDASGCQQSRSFFIQEPDQLTVEVLAISDEACPGMENGAIDAEIMGGTSPYTYHWNGAGLGQSLNPQNIAAGTYVLSVNDENGCTTGQGIVVGQGEAVEIQMSGTDVLCHGTESGSISVEISGGETPYTYHWNGAGFGQTLNPQGVQAGEYTFTATDSEGCQASAQYMVSEPAAISASLLEMIPDSCDMNAGGLEIQVSGGTGAKTIRWDDSDNQTGNVLSQVRFGIYTAEIEDVNDCIAFFTSEVEEAACSTTGLQMLDQATWRIFPNPIQDGVFTLDLGDGTLEGLEISLLDITGQVVERWSRINLHGQQEFAMRSTHAEGIYFLRLSDAESSITRKVIIR